MAYKDIDKKKQYQKGYQQRNKEHLKEYSEKYRQKNKEHAKEYAKEYRYKRIYNLTLEEIDQILIVQNHRCILCGILLIETKRCIDHDHKTEMVRGILCNKCNTGLGYLQYFYDNPELLKKAIEYIKIKNI